MQLNQIHQQPSTAARVWVWVPPSSACTQNNTVSDWWVVNSWQCWMLFDRHSALTALLHRVLIKHRYSMPHGLIYIYICRCVHYIFACCRNGQNESGIATIGVGVGASKNAGDASDKTRYSQAFRPRQSERIERINSTSCLFIRYRAKRYRRSCTTTTSTIGSSAYASKHYY